MRAVVIDQYGDADNMCMADLPVPTPDENEVRIRVRAAGVNPVDAIREKGMHTDG